MLTKYILQGGMIVVCLAFSGPTWGQTPIAITNPSFEDSSGNELSGWTEVGGTAAHFQSFSDAVATDGGNVASLRGLHTMLETSGITQSLGVNFAPGTYVLTFDAASRDTVSGTTSIYAGLYYGNASQATTVGAITPLLTGGIDNPLPGLATYMLEVSLPGGDAIGQPIGIQFANAGANGVFLPGTNGEGLASNTLLLDNLSLTFESSAGLVPGDADGDTDVDFDDFIHLSDRLFTDVTPFMNGDFNGSGQPDFDDFGTWKDIYAAGGGNLALLDAYYAQVPEPTTLSLVACGGLLLFMAVRRR